MRTKKIIETHVGELKEGWNWLLFQKDKKGDVFEIEDEETIKEAAHLWGVSPELVAAIRDALAFMSQSIIEELEKDLIDIWEVINKEAD